MVWSLALDVLLVLVFIAAVVNGYRAGLLRTAAGLVGLVLGGVAAFFVMPWVAGLIPVPEWRAPAAITAALVLVSLGAWLGSVVGHALGRGARAVKLGVLDRMLGGVEDIEQQSWLTHNLRIHHLARRGSSSHAGTPVGKKGE